MVYWIVEGMPIPETHFVRGFSLVFPSRQRAVAINNHSSPSNMKNALPANPNSKSLSEAIRARLQ